MKKIEIEIPDEKVAKWVSSVLILVNKDIIKRIKTVKDACAELGEKHPLVTQYRLSVAAAYIGDPMTEDFIAFLKLRIIATALNGGWEPTFEKDEKRWYPWFNVRQGNFVYVNASYAGSFSSSSSGVRLAFKSKELAEYAGKQFTDIYKDFCYKTSNQEQ